MTPKSLGVHDPRDYTIFRHDSFFELLDTMDHIELVDTVQAQRVAVCMGKSPELLYQHWLWVNTYFKSNQIKTVPLEHSLPKMHTRGG